MNIFLSYSREDTASAITLEAQLRGAGARLFRDPPLLIGDPFWREQVAARLAESDAMIVLWSSHADASPWVDQELRAYSGTTFFILMDGTPLRIYDHESQRFQLIQKGNALCALRTFLPATSPSATTVNDCQPYPEHDLALLSARQEEIRSAHGRLRHLLKRVKRPAMLSMTLNGVINAWDGSTLKAISADRDGRAWVATEPVTNRQYESFIHQWKLEEPPTWGRPEFRIPELPVVGVTWFEAMLYAAWVGGGLPTESEWMRAATLADPAVTFATATGEINPQLAHYNSRFGSGGPAAVTTFAATQGGYYGMCGNTWDWCDSDDAGYKVIKGGGYSDSPLFCRIQARYRNSPLDRDCNVGFRIKVIDSD